MVCVNALDLALTIFLRTFLILLVMPIIFIKDMLWHGCIFEHVSASSFLCGGPSNFTVIDAVEVVVKTLLNRFEITKCERSVEEFIVPFKHLNDMIQNIPESEDNKNDIHRNSRPKAEHFLIPCSEDVILPKMMRLKLGGRPQLWLKGHADVG